MKMHSPLIGIAAASGLMLLAAAAFLFVEGPCPVRMARGGVPWLKPYHLGENPWIDAWVASGDQAGSPKVAVAVPNTPTDHVETLDTCERSTHDVKPKFPS